MPRASVADAAATGLKVLTEAGKLFAERGYAAVALEDVAQAASVTRGAVYHHYKNKQNLFRAVAARLQTQVAQAVVDAADAADPSPAAQLRAGSHAFLDAITSPANLRILLIDAPAVIGWQDWRAMDEQNSATHLRDALRDCGVAEDLLEATAAQLSGAMNEAALWIAQHDDPTIARTQAHAALDQLLAAYLS